MKRKCSMSIHPEKYKGIWSFDFLRYQGVFFRISYSFSTLTLMLSPDLSHQNLIWHLYTSVSYLCSFSSCLVQSHLSYFLNQAKLNVFLITLPPLKDITWSSLNILPEERYTKPNLLNTTWKSPTAKR